VANISLAIYDGTRRVGELEDRGRGQVTAFKIDGTKRVVGVYPTPTEAMRAVIGTAGDRRSA
jgi:hypothetical protein